MEAVVSVPGAEPWSAQGAGDHARVGVVVVHGLTANPMGTRPLGQRLAAEGYAVEVPLLPGHGTNHRDLAHTTYADWAGAVDRVVDHLRHGCQTVVLIGHSMGGTIALDLASRRDDVDAVAVINAPVLGPKRSGIVPALGRVVPYLPREVVGMPADDIARPGIEEASYPIVAMRAYRSLLDELPRIRDRLPQVTQPLLIAWSPDDHTVSPTNSRALRDLVASTDVAEVVCDRSYHVALLDYDGPRLEQAVVDFVGRVAGV